MRNTRYVLAFSSLLLAGTAWGQVTPPAVGSSPPPAAPAAPPAVPTPVKPVPYGAGMKVNLSPDGSKYIRFIGWTQFWAQYNENNSNTLRDNVQKSDQVAFGLRRTRVITLAQLNPRFLFLLDLGMENQTTISGSEPNDPNGPGKRAPFYVHNATGEFKVNKYLSVGAGLNYQVGISRMSQASTLNIMTLDLPIVNFPTLDQTDQFGFFMGAYAKGRIGGLDYRFAIDDPFVTNQAAATATPAGLRTNVAAFNPRNTNKIYQGYVDYEFLEKEANLLPYQTGTYLGTKRVLNIGAGFHYNPDGAYSRSQAYPTTAPADPFSTTTNHDIKLFGADIFYDAPIDTASRTAITFYGVYYNYNFGPNYVRSVGLLNPGNGYAAGTPFTTAANAPASALYGNAAPTIGTGQSYYAQLGVLLPKNLLGPKVKLQPYVAYLHNSLNGLIDTDGNIKGVNIYDAGMNFYIDGHNAKITINYRARPDFSDQVFLPANNGAATVNSVRYRPEVTLQTQIYL